MDRLTDTYNAVAGLMAAVFSAVFGAYWYIFAAYFLCMVLDYATGWYKARLLHIESSAAGLRGIVKKTGYWVMIAVSFLVANVFVKMGQDVLKMDLSFLTNIGWFTLSCLLINEVRSILENLVECGCKVPDILIRGLAIAQKMIGQQNLGKTDEPSDSEILKHEH